jgi:exodeoxyribonuclease III
VLLATWNVNSVRARLDRLLAWLARTGPDVVCLQELKVPGEEFPFDALREAGYHAAVFGQRTYNGVAILSRHAPDEVRPGFGDTEMDDQARLIGATIGGIVVVSAYVPNGQVVGSDKWAYKLAWLGRLRAWLEQAGKPDRPLVLAGDFNVAPEDRDVARPEEWQESVLCHPDARRALRDVMGWGLVDAVRLHDEGPGPWSWWDYRQLAFPRGNGLRIDHVFLTAPLAGRCTRAWVDREERKGKLPSDHAPVVVELAG